MNEIFVIVFPEIPVENCVVGMLITGTMWDVDLKKTTIVLLKTQGGVDKNSDSTSSIFK